MPKKVHDDFSVVLRIVEARSELPEPSQRAAIRRDSGLSQAAVGRIIGCHASMVCRYERGALPRGLVRLKYAETLRSLSHELLRANPETDAA